MADFNRRRFLSDSMSAGLTAAASAGLAATAQGAARVVSANEKIVLGVIGIRGRGSSLGPAFAGRPDCEVAYLADVDSTLFESRAKGIADVQGKSPQAVQDFRRILDDKAVDAVIVATPDHWHALATVWACQAEKDVYVEKPVSHSPWEGRKMVEAARKYNRVVQAGLQNRSARYNQSAKAYIDEGKLGTIHLVRVYNQKEWGNVPAADDSDPPAGFDWNMWNGPAEEAHYNVRLHGTWNHFWRYSGGDIINDGVHQIDLARWLIGRDYPRTVYSVGGRFAQAGVLETPDTQIAVYEFEDLVMTFELTLYTPYMIKSDAALRDSDDFPYWPQNAERIEIFGSKGLMIIGRHGCGWQVYDRPHSRLPVIAASENGPFPDPEHKQNFCDAIRSRQKPSADIEEGHKSTLLCQFANISYRLGGEKLTVDGDKESFVNNSRANGMLKRDYRSPWIVPERV
jgi:predicted dehydrogenase